MALRLRVVVSASVVLLVALALPAFEQAASAAATIKVNTANDSAADGKCALREAVEAANTNTAVDSCHAGGTGTDTIIFALGLNGTAINLTNGPIDIHSNLLIKGNGRTKTIVTGDEFDTTAKTSTLEHMTLVLVNNESATATVIDVRATDEMNNNSTGTETSIMRIIRSRVLDVTTNSGFGTSVTSLIVSRSRTGLIDNNSGSGTTSHLVVAASVTGEIDNNSGSSTTTAVIRSSTMRGDGVNGDGVDVSGTGTTVSIRSSTITRFDEGIFSDGHTRLTNSTVSGNVDENVAVGGGSFHVLNSTITHSDTGIDQFGGTITLTNSILANHPGSGNCIGTVGSGGGNISDDLSCGFNHTRDRNNINPKLGALGFHGGLTMTQVPLAGSPAIDKGLNPPCPAFDQRGHKRPTDGNGDGVKVCDKGSVEVPRKI